MSAGIIKKQPVVAGSNTAISSKSPSYIATEIFYKYFCLFCKTVSLGMITQLFPGLELKSREFAALFGIFPFKKRLEEFMQHNDPSSLLREILVRIYEEQGGFEKVPDLLFVYNMMYNSNSLNVRNECIHGRGYLSGGSLQFALTVTLCSRYMIAFKINTIKEKVSDILDVSEEAQQPIYPPPACSVHRLFQRPLSASIGSLTENTNDWGLRWGQALMM